MSKRSYALGEAVVLQVQTAGWAINATARRLCPPTTHLSIDLGQSARSLPRRRASSGNRRCLAKSRWAALQQGLHKGGYNRGQNCPQVDLSFAPLRDPVAPHPTSGRVISPHGLIGQSFDGDGIAVDGKMDHCAIAARATPHTPFSPRAHSARPPQTASCGGGSRLSNRMKSRQRRRQKAP